MDLSTFSEEELLTLPVFPLPDAVLLPGCPMGLRAFEPRYKAMMAFCMGDGGGVMAIAQLDTAGQPDEFGRPAIHRAAGIGRVVQHTENPDGTHDFVVLGVHRATLIEHAPTEQPFRTARAETIADIGKPDPNDLRALATYARSIEQVIRERRPGFELGVDLDAEGMVDKIADRVMSPDLRQQVLESPSVADRTAMVTACAGQLWMDLISGDQSPD